jgi:hypothetical protein
MSSAPGETPRAHVCVAYDDPTDLRTHAQHFLADGLAAGEQVWYIAADRPAGLDDRVRFVPTGRTYAHGAVVDPAAQVDFYAAATRDAVAAGHTGLRVVAEATELVVTPAQLDAFCRYEHLVDRYMCGHPFTAMCAYDRRMLDATAVARLVCLHPRTNTDDVPFTLHAAQPGEGAAVLAGELDMTAWDLLSATLEAVDLPSTAGEVVLQATGLRFADHRSLLRLQDYALDAGVTVVLRSANAALGRLAGMMELPGVRVEVAR